jgi:hypothetical protein
MSLFPSQPKETVQDCVQRQIEILKLAYNDWSKLINILDGGAKSLEELLPDYWKQTLVQKCLYLCRAYRATKKYNKAGKQGRDFDEIGKLKPEIARLLFLPTLWPLVLTLQWRTSQIWSI